MKPTPLELEENEERWWGLWCQVYRRPWGLLYHNPAFDEPIFNHATRVTPDSRVPEVVGAITGWFQRRGLTPHIYVTPFFNEGSWERELPSLGYQVEDELVTLLLTRDVGVETGPHRVIEVGSGGLQAWAQCYSLAFYGAEEPKGAVMGALKRVAGSRAATLYAALEGDTVVGVMALFQHGGVLGLYCLGTLPSHRGRGVGSRLLRHAAERARRLHLDLALQTFRGDGLLEFYLKAGFTIQYVKRVYSLARRGASRSPL